MHVFHMFSLILHYIVKETGRRILPIDVLSHFTTFNAIIHVRNSFLITKIIKLIHHGKTLSENDKELLSRQNNQTNMTINKKCAVIHDILF